MHFDCLFIVLSLHTLVKLKCSHPALRVLYPDWINTVCHVGQLTVRQTPEESEPPPPPILITFCCSHVKTSCIITGCGNCSELDLQMLHTLPQTT